VGLVIMCLITAVFGPGPFKGVLFGQTVLLIFDGVAIVVTFIFLLVYFLTMHLTHLYFWPWSASVRLSLSPIRCPTFPLLRTLSSP